MLFPNTESFVLRKKNYNVLLPLFPFSFICLLERHLFQCNPCLLPNDSSISHLLIMFSSNHVEEIWIVFFFKPCSARRIQKFFSKAKGSKHLSFLDQCTLLLSKNWRELLRFFNCAPLSTLEKLRHQLCLFVNVCPKPVFAVRFSLRKRNIDFLAKHLSLQLT